jgi:hypothetical protein
MPAVPVVGLVSAENFAARRGRNPTHTNSTNSNELKTLTGIRDPS